MSQLIYYTPFIKKLCGAVCDFCCKLISDIRSGYFQKLPDQTHSYKTKKCNEFLY